MTQEPQLPRLPRGLSPGGRFDSWRAEPVGWVACDVDGTMLGPDDEVSDAVVEALTSVATNTPVGMVTGRMRQGAQRVHDRMALPGPHVFHNGAQVRMDARTIASSPLTSDELAATLTVATTHDAYCELYTDEFFVVTRMDPRARRHWLTLDQEPAGLVDPDLSEDFLKATLIGFDHEESRRLADALLAAGLSVGNGISLAHPDLTYINVTASGVTKATAMQAAADHLGLTLDNVVMIGDGHNDLPALAVAGTAIAMGQADAEVKALAHLVTDPVTADGVAVAMQALDLLKGSGPVQASS